MEAVVPLMPIVNSSPAVTKILTFVRSKLCQPPAWKSVVMVVEDGRTAGVVVHGRTGLVDGVQKNADSGAAGSEGQDVSGTDEETARDESGVECALLNRHHSRCLSRFVLVRSVRSPSVGFISSL
jgi:hypothetical protein